MSFSLRKGFEKKNFTPPDSSGGMPAEEAKYAAQSCREVLNYSQ
jgi:hypothetical protein